MTEIDDFFVINNVDQGDLNEAIKKYKYFKNSTIPENYLKKHFNVLTQNSKNILFKKKEIKNNPLQEFWTLRFIDIAENINNKQINKYSSIDKNDLKKIAEICLDDKKILNVKNFLLQKGIYLYFIDFLPGTKIDGAVFYTSKSSIAVGLTARYERLDHIWFCLLHELSHIILHFQYLEEGIISIENSQDIKEIEANRLAKDSIISPEKYRVCIPKRTLIADDVYKYAKANNIHPVLLAGIIRRDLNDYSIFNNIIKKYEVKRSDFYGSI